MEINKPIVIDTFVKCRNISVIFFSKIFSHLRLQLIEREKKRRQKWWHTFCNVYHKWIGWNAHPFDWRYNYTIRVYLPYHFIVWANKRSLNFVLFGIWYGSVIFSLHVSASRIETKYTHQRHSIRKQWN